MKSNRRKILASVGLASTVSVTGCVDYLPLANDDSTGGSESTENNQNSSNQSEEGDVSDSDNDQPELSGIAKRTDQLITGLQWLTTEYPSSYDEYQKKVSAVVDHTDQLITTVESGNTVNDSEIDALFELSSDVEGIGDDLFGEYFDSHYSFWSFNDEYEPKVRRNHRRSETDFLLKNLKEYRSFYRGRNSAQSLQLVYPVDPLSKGLYELFVNDPQFQGHFFEVKFHHDRDELTRFATPGAKYDVSPRPFSTPRGSSFLESHVDLVSAETDRVSETTIRINRPPEEDEYPNEDEGEGEVSLDGWHTLTAHIQQYETPEAAESAYKDILSTFTVERQVERASETWDQVFTTEPDDNVYGDILQSHRFVLSLGFSTTPWENREPVVDEDRHEGGLAQTWDWPIRGTWLDQPDEEQDG